MTFTYHFGENDLLCWWRHYYKSSPSSKAARTRYIVASSASFLLAATLIGYYWHSWVAAFVSFAFAGVFCLFIPVAYDRHVDYQLRRSVSDPQVRGGFGEHRLTLADDGLREVTPATESLAKWPSVTDVIIDRDHIYIRLASGQAAVISRHSYSGPVAFEQIPQVIHEQKQKHAT
jgi:hypothetical protein